MRAAKLQPGPVRRAVEGGMATPLACRHRNGAQLRETIVSAPVADFLAPGRQADQLESACVQQAHALSTRWVGREGRLTRSQAKVTIAAVGPIAPALVLWFRPLNSGPPLLMDDSESMPVTLVKPLLRRGGAREGEFYESMGSWAKLWLGLRRFGICRTLRGVLSLMRYGFSGVRFGVVAVAEDELRIGFLNPSQRPCALILYGHLMEPEYELIRRVVEPGSVVFDVGGGIGTYAMVAARRSKAGVHLFEPHEDNVATIRDNIARNGLGQHVIVNAVAVSDRCGSADLALGGSAFETRIARVFDDPGQGTVKTVSLDSYCQVHDIAVIDVLKIDVEGHEAQVLAGAHGLLAANRVRMVIVEMGSAYGECRQLLHDHGFEVFIYLEGPNELLAMQEKDHAALASRRPTSFHCNIVALAPVRSCGPSVANARSG